MLLFQESESHDELMTVYKQSVHYLYAKQLTLQLTNHVPVAMAMYSHSTIERISFIYV